MHVLHFIDSLAPAGAERSLAALAPHLVAAGVRLGVATFSERRGVQDELAEAGVEVSTLAATTRAARVRQAQALIRALRPELVHTTLFEADIAGRIAAALSRVPAVSTIASVAYGPEHRATPGLRPWRVVAAQAADAASARTVRRFHAVSRHVARVMGSRLVIPAARIDVVPRGRDAAVLGRRTPERRRSARVLLGVPERTTLVLAVARHEHQKGLDVLLEAAPGIRGALGDVRIVVAGRFGGQTPWLRERAEDLGLAGDVLFLGPREDVSDLLCAADVFVLPSRWEGLPGALIEAMALEAPVVASDLGPVREVVGEEHALLVKPGDPAALSDAVVVAATDGHSAGRRTAAARDRFTGAFTIEAAAVGMVSFYERALRG